MDEGMKLNENFEMWIPVYLGLRPHKVAKQHKSSTTVTEKRYKLLYFIFYSAGILHLSWALLQSTKPYLLPNL